MALSREEIDEIASNTAQKVFEGLQRYAVEYKEPRTVEQGLRDSMVEEWTAENWYKKRARQALDLGDRVTRDLYLHNAEEEHGHYREFNYRLDVLEGRKSEELILGR